MFLQFDSSAYAVNYLLEGATPSTQLHKITFPLCPVRVVRYCIVRDVENIILTRICFRLTSSFLASMQYI